MNHEHILIDGYSMIFQWPELQRARSQSLAKGRDILLQILTQYQDCTQKRIVLVFDGRSFSKGSPSIRTNVQIRYTQQGQTADALIERIVGQSPHPHLYLVATDDLAEQNTIQSLGGRTVSADLFHSMIREELGDLKNLIRDTSSPSSFNKLF